MRYPVVPVRLVPDLFHLKSSLPSHSSWAQRTAGEDKGPGVGVGCVGRQLSVLKARGQHEPEYIDIIHAIDGQEEWCPQTIVYTGKTSVC